jgi:hypothetical protein
MHADTVDYLDWGGSVDEINAAVAERLSTDDLTAWWECWRKLTTRYAYRGTHGADVADQVLDLLGGDRIVHGHSVIADQIGVLPEEVTGPHEYAGGRVLGVDAGVFLGAPCLIVQLPYEPVAEAS